VRHIFTPEQIEFLRNHVVGRSKQALTDIFNEHFGLTLTLEQISRCARYHKLPHSGLDGRFKPGNTPFNKGKKGISIGGKETQYKKGHKPQTYRPVGSERVCVDGYAEIKVADPNKWKPKHVLLWEEANGPIPSDCCLLFLDRNKLNITLDNLQLITRKQLARLNQNHLIFNNPELTKTGIILADIYNRIGERRRQKDERLSK
jgi:hypothetical protein